MSIFKDKDSSKAGASGSGVVEPNLGVSSFSTPPSTFEERYSYIQTTKADPTGGLGWTQLVASWKTGEDAIAWGAKYGVTPEQLGNAGYLKENMGRDPDLKQSFPLHTLRTIIGRDPRFKNWSEWRRFLGQEKESIDWNVLLASWKSAQDVFNWAEARQIPKWTLTSAKHLLVATFQEPGQEREYRLQSLYKAINRNTDRFPTWDSWVAFLGGKIAKPRTSASNPGSRIKAPSEGWKALVESWKTPELVLTWGRSIGLTRGDLGSRTALTEKGYSGLVGALVEVYKTDSHTGWYNYRKWMGFSQVGGQEKGFWVDLVRSWESSEDAIAWGKTQGMSAKQLGNSEYLRKNGFGGLHDAITVHFEKEESQTKGWMTFKVWLGLTTDRTTTEDGAKRKQAESLVRSWSRPEDALNWANEVGLTLEQLGDRDHLRNSGFRRIANAIERRFQKQGEGGWQNFRSWLGLGSPSLFFVDGHGPFSFEIPGSAERDIYKSLFSSWKRPADAISWGASKGLSTEQLGSANCLTEQGYGVLVEVIKDSISGDRRSAWRQFREWLGLGNQVKKPVEEDMLKTLFNSPEGRALEALARDLGEAALAEYLCAKYQDRFKYRAELIENLRKYLGEIDYGPGIHIDSFPGDVFSIDKLENLRRALFAHYRDAFGPQFSQGLELVVAALTEYRERAEFPEQRAFIESLIDYFRAVDDLAHPVRLKESLGRGLTFPAPHQKVAIRELIEQRAMLVADEMGGGKTGSSIAAFESLRDLGLAKKALIVCPAKVLPVWRKVLSTGEGGYFLEGNLPKVAFIDGSRESWQQARRADYVVISLERSRRETAGRPNAEWIMSLGCDLLVVDEAHNAKSLTGSDTERLYKIAQSESIRSGYLLLLSGTPVPNSLRDIAAQIRLLYAGREEIAGCDVETLQTLAKEVTASHPLLVRNLLVRRMLRRKTEDCLPVGQCYTRELVSCELNQLERARYDVYLENPFLSATEKIRTLRQLCLQSESKFELLKTAIERALERPKYLGSPNSPKILVAETHYARGVTRDESNLRAEQELGLESYLGERLRNEFSGKLKLFVLDGLNSVDRQQVINEFRDCPEPALLLTLVPVVGEGLDITCAADGILITPAYNRASEEQFMRRMYRAGQQMPVDLQILHFKDTIEEGMLKYADRKYGVVSAVVDGRPLTALEKEILQSDTETVRDGGFIAYDVMSPRQQARWILSKIQGRSKQEISAFLWANDGKYAKDFARGYPEDEETSSSGNTARVVAALIEVLPKGSKTKIADIACGCLTLERMYEGSKEIKVSGVDINEAALQVGAELLQSPREIRSEEVGSMDELPFADSSQDIAVLSLALELTQHSFKRGDSGLERVKALSELNRVLKLGGHAVLTFQDSLFESEEQFARFSQTIASEFGFAIKAELTGLVAAQRETGQPAFEVWALTLEKVAISAPDLASDKLWLNLRFPKIRYHTQAKEFAARGGKASGSGEASGAYYDSFVLAQRELEFVPTTPLQQEAESERLEQKKQELRLADRIQELIKDYGQIGEIPEHLLLSISPFQVSQARQEQRDQYFETLLKRYRSIERVPVDQISKNSPVIVVRGYAAKKGPFLCLAQLSDSGNARGFGRRYFYQDLTEE